MKTPVPPDSATSHEVRSRAGNARPHRGSSDTFVSLTHLASGYTRGISPGLRLYVWDRSGPIPETAHRRPHMEGRWPGSGAFAIFVILVAWPAAAQTVNVSRCGAGVHEAEGLGSVLFPEDQIFCPLVADPKEPRSFASYLRGKFRTLDDPSGEMTNIAAVGLGDSFGLVRFGGPSIGEGLQLDVIGSIFAQFDLGAPSNDLINADYVIGVPLTFRRRGFSLRTKLYHQSSHLGDEYLP